MRAPLDVTQSSFSVSKLPSANPEPEPEPEPEPTHVVA